MWERDRHGPLPELLLALTVVTGLVDAVSILHLGRVFVANMTGNVVFVAFAVAGAPGFSLGASLSALLGFLVGAALGGVLTRRVASDRADLVAIGIAAELALAGAGLAAVMAAGTTAHGAALYLAAGLLAAGMGTQNVVVRALAVPDLTTTVLTLTLTGLVGGGASGTERSARPRRALAVVTMFGGGLLGAVLVIHHQSGAALGIAVALLVLVVTVGFVVRTKEAAWRAGLR